MHIQDTLFLNETKSGGGVTVMVIPDGKLREYQPSSFISISSVCQAPTAEPVDSSLPHSFQINL